ncbi:Asp23/Gls24 family envelope stress response protein [Olsenella intestinalis]|uniref:Asp23/Gls24 family envelope stress response protein n=1 Tax=Olsenella intestinalis TaxID=2930083 RepID=UPI0024B1AC8F|nr:Asp23/Gls24 family envelope stress response protein [Olsenella intestinalis]
MSSKKNKSSQTKATQAAQAAEKSAAVAAAEVETAAQAEPTADDAATDVDADLAADGDITATSALAAPDDAELDEDEDLDSEDSLTFSNGVIEKIVAVAMRDVPGVIGMKGGWLNRVQDVIGASDPRKGVTVEVTPDAAVRVNISVLIEYGAYAPQVFEDVKRAVVSEVTGMTGLSVAGVNLRIEDVLTAEELADRRGEAVRDTPALAPADDEE